MTFAERLEAFMLSNEGRAIYYGSYFDTEEYCLDHEDYMCDECHADYKMYCVSELVRLKIEEEEIEKEQEKQDEESLQILQLTGLDSLGEHISRVLDKVIEEGKG